MEMGTIECPKCGRMPKIRDVENQVLFVCDCGHQLINRLNDYIL